MRKYIILVIVIIVAVFLFSRLNKKEHVNKFVEKTASEKSMVNVVEEVEVTNPRADRGDVPDNVLDNRFRIYKSKVSSDHYGLYRCEDKRLDLTFLCARAWELQDQGTGFFLIINQNPNVIMGFAEMSQKIFSIYQLNRPVIDKLGLYKDGYGTEQVTVSGVDALKVKGYSRGFPNTRLTGYYFVKDEALYSLIFSVDPKEAWNDYQFLTEKIMESFRFNNPV